MPKNPPNDPVAHASTQMTQMLNRLWQWHESNFCPVDSWSPSINLYRMERRIEVCVDLAGMVARSIDVQVEPGRLTIRGVRAAPEPPRREGEAMRIVSMEIDHGAFCRVIGLPDQVDLTRVESEYTNGLLWIRLPLRIPG